MGTAWVITRFADGTEVHAHPNHRPEDEVRARNLGYPDVQGMTFDHDQLHSRLAWALGLPHSPTMWALAHGEELNQPLTDLEEMMVLAAQRFLTEVKNEAQAGRSAAVKS